MFIRGTTADTTSKTFGIFNFFNGGTALYYALVVLAHIDLLESASADMSAESSLNSASFGTASSNLQRSQSARLQSSGDNFHPQEESSD
jgi:hypothetical protein